MEALCKLLNGQIRSHSRTNVVQTRAFSERLEDAIARYHSNAITTAQVIQELIELAKDIWAARQRGEEEGLSQEEIAFYDALAENESAVQVMGDEQLRVIAHELLKSVKNSVTIDHKDSQQKASEKLKISIGFMSELENGKRNITLSILEKYSKVYNVDISALLFLAEKNHKS